MTTSTSSRTRRRRSSPGSDGGDLNGRLPSRHTPGYPEPHELYSHLNEYVIGQDEAKKALSVEVSNHFQRVRDAEPMAWVRSPMRDHPDLADVVIEKSNIVLIGPSGSGKTLLARSLAEKVGVPFAIGDATSLTEAGYVGEDVENLLLKLLNAADHDVETAQRGIVYIDEIDKLRKTGGNVSITRDVGGEGVQQSLLKMIEGTVANVPPQGGRKHPEQHYTQLDTTNILFIVGGAFVGIEDVVRRRTGNHVRQRSSSLLREVTHGDLIQFGIIPELAGRLPVLATLDAPTLSDLKRILVEPKNALLLQERKKLALRGVDLRFTDGAVEEIAKQAITKGTGARALRTVVAEFMRDIHFNLPASASGRKFVIDEQVVRRKKALFPQRGLA